MNKKKSLLLVILSFVMAFALVFAFGCNGCNKDDDPENPGNTTGNPDDKLLSGNYEGDKDVEDDPADAWVLQEISLNVENVTTEYAFGEEFKASEKPVVTAKYASVESLIKYEETKLLLEGVAEVEYKTETVTDVKIDAGQYNKNAVGTYRIFVSFTHAGVTRSAYYEVTVKGTDPEVGGLTVELDSSHSHYSAETQSLVYYIASEEGVDVDISGGFHVYPIDKDQNKGAEVAAATEDAEGYTLTYYKEGTKIDNLNGLQKGTYTVYVTYNSTSTFFVVDVLDPIDKLEVKEGVGTFEQEQGPVESMSATWVFTVTYRSGLTAEVKKGDAGLLIPNIITVLAVPNGEATVVYIEGNDQGSVTVNYTVTAKAGVEAVSDKYDHTIYQNSLEANKDTDLTAAHLTGKHAFLKLGADNAIVRYRLTQEKPDGVLEIRNDALQVEFYGFGMLKLSVRSTGASNTSSIALKDKDGNLISAIYKEEVDTTGKVLIKEGTTENGKAYLVTGDVQKQNNGGSTTNLYAARDLTFIISEPGVYTICTLSGVTADGEAVMTATGRNTRIYQIEKTDVYDSSADRVSYEFAINADRVEKDYVANESNVVDTTNLTATLTEKHSSEDIQDTVTDLTADQLTVKFVDCDWSKAGYGKTGKVEVSYEHGGETYKASYVINILSPIKIGEERVNSVKIEKATVDYALPDAETTTIAIANDDIKFYANSGTTEVNGTTDIKLYSSSDKTTALESWTVGAGTYTVVAKITVAHTENDGSTEFSKEFTVTVEAYTAPGDAKEYESFFVPVIGSADANPGTTYGEGGKISENTLFTLNAAVAAGMHIGTSYGAIQNITDGNPGSNALSFTDSKGVAHNPDLGIRHSDADVASGGSLDPIYKVTAKENITLYLYVVFTNNSYNSNRSGATISYSIKGVAPETKTSGNRNVATVIEVRLNKNETLTVGVSKNGASAGRLWLFGAEAKKEAEPVERVQTYTATFHLNSENEKITALTVPAEQIISKDGKITAPEAFPEIAGVTFGGWFTAPECEGTAYDFDTAVTADVDLYAKWTIVETVTVTYHVDGAEGVTAPAAQTINKGGVAENAGLRAGNYIFGGWYATSDCSGDAYNFETAVNTDLDLYAKLTAIDYSDGETFTFNFGVIPVKEKDSTALTDNDFTGANSFLTVATKDKVTYRTSKYIELKDDAMKVTFAGSGTLKITFSSTGGSNYSALFVKNSAGNYLTATYATDTAITTQTTDNGTIYIVNGSSAKEFTFTIAEAGEYVFGSVNVAVDGVANKTTNSAVRIRTSGIVMTVDPITTTGPETTEPEVEA